jgi:hypothetical protein
VIATCRGPLHPADGIQVQDFSTVGFTPIWRHDTGHAVFAYLEHASRDGVVVKVLQLE